MPSYGSQTRKYNQRETIRMASEYRYHSTRLCQQKQPPQQTMISWSWKWSNNHYGCLGNLHFSQGRKMRNDQYTRTIYIKCNWYIFILHWHRYAYGVHIKSVTHDYGDDLKHQNQFPNVYIYNACREWVQENPFHIANIQSTYRE